MELRQLEYLVTVVEEASFTRAAARLHVAQPGVSAQIRQLERELGQTLLDRTSQGVRLTEAGAAVLPYARAALAAVPGARQAADELSGLLRGHLTIGTVGSISSPDVDVPALLAGFHADHPGVDISLIVGTSDELLAAVRTGEIDLAFAGLGSTAPADIGIHVLTSEPLAAVVVRTDPLAAQSVIALTALAGRTLIALPRGTGLRSCIDDACLAAGFTPSIALEAADPRVVAELAARGLGVGIVPRAVAQADRRLHAVTIDPPALVGRIALAWRTEGPASPAARVLTARVRAAPPPG
jgi:DNA-binding transcriptional LysR family regulator